LPAFDDVFVTPYASQGLTVVALNPYDPDALNVGGVAEYLSYLDVSYRTGIETNGTYDAFTAIYQGSNPYPLDIIVGRDQTIRYIGRELDIPAMDAIIQEALAE